jgi:hypothetical protein
MIDNPLGKSKRENKAEPQKFADSITKMKEKLPTMAKGEIFR